MQHTKHAADGAGVEVGGGRLKRFMRQKQRQLRYFNRGFERLGAKRAHEYLLLAHATQQQLQRTALEYVVSVTSASVQNCDIFCKPLSRSLPCNC